MEKQALIEKAKRLDVHPNIKQGVLNILEYITQEERKKLHIVEEFQSEFYLEYNGSQIIQILRQYDYAGTPTIKSSAPILVKDLPELYFKYQVQIDEALTKGKKL